MTGFIGLLQRQPDQPPHFLPVPHHYAPRLGQPSRTENLPEYSMSRTNSLPSRPLTSRQERNLMTYLDDHFLQITRNFKKRSVALSITYSNSLMSALVQKNLLRFVPSTLTLKLHDTSSRSFFKYLQSTHPPV